MESHGPSRAATSWTSTKIPMHIQANGDINSRTSVCVFISRENAACSSGVNLPPKWTQNYCSMNFTYSPLTFLSPRNTLESEPTHMLSARPNTKIICFGPRRPTINREPIGQSSHQNELAWTFYAPSRTKFATAAKISRAVACLFCW